ncbi:protein kinase [bacterium]|nr:protein kinase [bacterium]
MIGTTLSHYSIEAELGRGGMGIVYRAKDTKLDRTVAIKVLPASALSNEDDRARFYREAKAAASLNHPNIAAIYQIDEAVPKGGSLEEPRPFIAMEYIDGESLDARIKKGPFKIQEAVRIATQVAGALGAAHKQHVVHRDIKSANIMLTAEGDPKVLDFGLAQTSASTKLTRMGSTLGTVVYMSPEQARGEEVDGRTDLWALGIVLYEMIAGTNPFGGEYEQAVVYSILNSEPAPLTSLRTGVPLELERIVGKALAKSAEHRYQTASGFIADLKALNLQSVAAQHAAVSSPSGSIPPQAAARSLPVWMSVALFAMGAGLMGLMWAFLGSSDSAPRQVQRFEMVAPVNFEVSQLDISADGSTIAYIVSGKSGDLVYIQDVASRSVRLLEGTGDAGVVELSGDGTSILITNNLNISTSSTRVGAPVKLLESNEGDPRASYGPGGRIVYEDQSGIYVYDVNSGVKRMIVEADSLTIIDYDWPSVLPDGKTIMATIEYKGSKRGLGFWDIETGEEKQIIQQGGYRAQYVPTGYLVFVIGGAVESGNLVAMPFDLSSLSQTGPIVPVASGVVAEKMAVSDTGTLLYGSGRVGTSYLQTDLYLLEANGATEKLPFQTNMYAASSLELSPDEGRALVNIIEGLSTVRQGDAIDTYILDLKKGTHTQLTDGGTGGSATWFSNSDSVVYVDNTNRSEGRFRVVIRAADGRGVVRELFSSVTGIQEIAISPDDETIAYMAGRTPTGATQLVARSLKTGQQIRLSDGTTASRRYPQFSPDGQKVFYQEDGILYERSADGSGLPTRLLGDVGNLAAVDQASGHWITASENTLALLEGENSEVLRSIKVPGSVTAADNFPGSQRFIIAMDAAVADPKLRSTQNDSLQTLTLFLNWFEELK